MIWFIIKVGGNTVCHQFRDCFPGYAEVQKKFFRENGTPVLAVVRPKPRGREFSSGGFVPHWP